MKKNKIYSTMLAVLITVMSVGLTSCKDEKEPEPEISDSVVMKKWYSYPYDATKRYGIEFKTDGTYSYTSENETFDGIYKTNGTEKIATTDTYKGITYSVDGILYPEGVEIEIINTYNATLFKMFASSGSSDFDQLWVYYSIQSRFAYLSIDLYYGNELVRHLGNFSDSY